MSTASALALQFLASPELSLEHGTRARAEHRYFVREAAVRAAEDVLMESTLFRMGPSGFNAFMKTLAAPPVAVPEMVELLKRPAPWETGGSRK